MSQIEYYDSSGWVVAGDGTVQSVTAGTGLTPITITTTGTLDLQDIPSQYSGTFSYTALATDLTGRVEAGNGVQPVITVEGTANQTQVIDVLPGSVRVALGDANTNKVEFPANINIGNGSFSIPSGTTAERSAAPVAGMLRINTDL
jgi:hypothetical protein